MKKTASDDVEGLRQQLLSFRSGLLGLHKALVESEKVEYERTMGKIASPNHFLQLLTTDPWFAWLHPLSELIVTIDEALDSKEPLTKAAGQGLIKRINSLLLPSESGEGFSRHYFDALQRDPDVVIAHGEVVRLRGRPPSSPK